MIAAIVAVDNNWGIGYNGELLEQIPEDMKYFKELTQNKPIIMGRKTWDSLPKKPLPNRINVVITHTEIPYCREGALFCNMDFIKQQAWYILQKVNEEDEWFIIGGKSIYEEFLPLCDRIYLTHIGRDHKNVDTYFPRIDKDPNWEIDTCTELRESITGIPYAFLTYKRV